MFHETMLRGTRSFWLERCGELLNMVKQLCALSAILTLNTADTRWPYLLTILHPENTVGQRPEGQVNHARQRFVKESPLVIAKFLQEWAEFFLKSVLFSEFQVKHY